MVLELALLVFPLFLPGFLLVNVLFPGRRSLGGEYDLLYRVFLGVVLSVAITILYGTLLILLAGADQVLLRPEVTWPGLALLALALFLIGLARGAYAPLVRLIGRTPAPPGDAEPEQDDLFGRLVEVSEALEAAEAAEDPDAAEIETLKAEKRQLEEQSARQA